MFKNITIENFKTIKSFISSEFNRDYIESELQFQNIFAWKEADNLQIHFDSSFAIVKGKIDFDFFFPPIALDENAFLQGLLFIEDYCIKNTIPILFFSITEKLSKYFANYSLTPQRNYYEYIHKTSQAINLSGKKLHAKRNFISRFLSTYDFEFIDYQEKHKPDIIKLINFWNKHNSETNEKKAILNILNNLDELECFCDCLYINNQLCGFVIGFESNNTGIILFEKANTEYVGIYPALENLFVKKRFSSLLYINRQEDMGIESLRKSKLSYQPEFLATKYFATSPLNVQVYDLYSLGFPEDSENYKTYFFESKIKTLKCRTLRRKNLVLSILFYKKQTLSLRGVDYTANFILALTTHPNYRGLDFASKLIDSTLNLFHKKNDFILLNPSDETFYKNFGFITYTQKSDDNIDFNKFEKVEVESLEEINTIYNNAVLKFNVYTKRCKKDFVEWLSEIEADSGIVYKLYSEGVLQGYAVYFKEKVEEYALLNREFSPFANMARLCNPIEVLKKYPFNKDFEIALKITDPIIDNNNCIIKMKHFESITEIYETDKYDAEISVDELTKLILLGPNNTESSIFKDLFYSNICVSLDKY